MIQIKKKWLFVSSVMVCSIRIATSLIFRPVYANIFIIAMNQHVGVGVNLSTGPNKHESNTIVYQMGVNVESVVNPMKLM
jgi:hypothetical protein